jgi:hypothetical protein
MDIETVHIHVQKPVTSAFAESIDSLEMELVLSVTFVTSLASN